MSRPGITIKPCEGCHEPGHRGTGELCLECQRYLKLGKEVAKQREAAAKDGSMVKIRIPSYLRGFHYGYSRQSSDLTHRLEKAIFQIVETTGAKLSGYLHGEDVQELFDRKYLPEDYRREGYLVPAAIVPVIRNLVEQIDVILKDASATGHAKGRNLLTGLATGEISVDDFNEATATNGQTQG